MKKHENQENRKKKTSDRIKQSQVILGLELVWRMFHQGDSKNI